MTIDLLGPLMELAGMNLSINKQALEERVRETGVPEANPLNGPLTRVEVAQARFVHQPGDFKIVGS